MKSVSRVLENRTCEARWGPRRLPARLQPVFNPRHCVCVLDREQLDPGRAQQAVDGEQAEAAYGNRPQQFRGVTLGQPAIASAVSNVMPRLMIRSRNRTRKSSVLRTAAMASGVVTGCCWLIPPWPDQQISAGEHHPRSSPRQAPRCKLLGLDQFRHK